MRGDLRSDLIDVSEKIDTMLHAIKLSDSFMVSRLAELIERNDIVKASRLVTEISSFRKAATVLATIMFAIHEAIKMIDEKHYADAAYLVNSLKDMAMNVAIDVALALNDILIDIEEEAEIPARSEKAIKAIENAYKKAKTWMMENFDPIPPLQPKQKQ